LNICLFLDIERRLAAPLPNSIKRPNATTVKPSIVPSKKGPIAKTQLTSAPSVASLPSQSSRIFFIATDFLDYSI
jgi:hypothetical protein